MKHKWHKEIKAWADGAEIEMSCDDGKTWVKFDEDWAITDGMCYRIKPQPKEPQYLYVYRDGQHHITFTTNPPYLAQNTWDIKLIGKIKLEVDDD